MRDIRIAAAISRSRAPDVDGNFEGMAELVQAAKKKGAALVCFPEMNMTGYGNDPAIREIAEPIPGPISRRLSYLAAAEDMVILAGMAERDASDRIFITHLAAMPDGNLHIYRKLHLAPPEQAVFSPGNEVPLFEVRGVRFGIQLCYDAHFPELSTLMAQKGAELIFIPHASPRGTPDEKYHSWRRHLPARAYDNSLFVVACNHTGENRKGLNFPGIAMVVDPSGNVIDKDLSDQEGIVVTDLRADALERVRTHKMRFFFPNRRPGLYERAQTDRSS